MIGDVVLSPFNLTLDSVQWSHLRPYDVQTVKNALVKFVHYATHYAISSVVWSNYVMEFSATFTHYNIYFKV